MSRATINNGPGKNQQNDSVLFDLEVYLIGMGHESRRNCFLFGKSGDLKVIIQHYPMLCFPFDSSSVVKDSADSPLRGSIWRRAGAGARESLEGAEETRQRLRRQALNLTEPQWSRGRSPTGDDPLYMFPSKVWSMETSIICPLTHTPASWFTWFLS